MCIMENIYLDRIVIERNGKKIDLAFIDMYKGAPIGTLECENASVFNYSSILNKEDAAAYVGEIDVSVHSGESASEKLRMLGFGFRDQFGRVHMEEGERLHHLHVEGEVCIDICCGACRLTTGPETNTISSNLGP